MKHHLHTYNLILSDGAEEGVSKDSPETTTKDETDNVNNENNEAGPDTEKGQDTDNVNDIEDTKVADGDNEPTDTAENGLTVDNGPIDNEEKEVMDNKDTNDEEPGTVPGEKDAIENGEADAVENGETDAENNGEADPVNNGETDAKGPDSDGIDMDDINEAGDLRDYNEMVARGEGLMTQSEKDRLELPESTVPGEEGETETQKGKNMFILYTIISFLGLFCTIPTWHMPITS